MEEGVVDKGNVRAEYILKEKSLKKGCSGESRSEDRLSIKTKRWYEE